MHTCLSLREGAIVLLCEVRQVNTQGVTAQVHAVSTQGMCCSTEHSLSTWELQSFLFPRTEFKGLLRKGGGVICQKT